MKLFYKGNHQKCKDGRDGRDGRDGLNGVNGSDGKNGKDGINGLDGKDGKNGKDGKPGEVVHKNWKECAWNNLNDFKDVGLVEVNLLNYNETFVFYFFSFWKIVISNKVKIFTT